MKLEKELVKEDEVNEAIDKINRMEEERTKKFIEEYGKLCEKYHRQISPKLMLDVAVMQK